MSAVALSWLASSTLKGSLVIALAMLVRGRIASRWMHALLLIAFVRLLMPIAPESSFSIFNLAPRNELAARPPVILEAPLVAPTTMEAVTLPVAQAAPRLDRTTIALLITWILGFAFVLLRAFVRSRALRRMLRDRVEVRLPLIDQCRDSLGLRRRVRAFETDAVATPSLHGWLRPMLLLPRGFTESFSHEQLRFVLLHELAHLRRGDVLVNWLTTFVQALHWFNPLVHLAAARLAEERELACDALALERLRSDERSAYGGTVLAVLERMRQPSPVPGLVGMTATHRQLKRRIIMIAAHQPQRRSSLLFAAALIAVALASLTDAVAGEPTVHRRVMEPLSPASEAVIRQLEAKVDAQLSRAGIEEILDLVSRRSGVAIAFADGALDDAARATTFTMNANNVPAHVVLTEALDSLDLAVRFQETGVVVEKIPEGSRLRARLFGAGGPTREAFIQRAPRPAGPGDADVMLFERTVEGHRELPPPADGDVLRQRVEVVDRAPHVAAEDGDLRRRVSFRGSREGQTEGTLELQVHRDATSSPR